MPKPVVSPEWVQAHLDDPKLVLIDCRFTMGEPTAGRARYAAGHLPGATYFDLEQDLSGPVQEHGGRHPLPDMQTFAEKLGRAGIGRDSLVVAYDEGAEMAARFWWMLRYAGHEAVAVLDGGYPAWVRAGRPVTTELPNRAPNTFVLALQHGMVADVTDVRQAGPDILIVDSRAAARFAGQPHPLDAKSGHIPGAISRFWQESLRPDGTWKSPAEQAERLAALRGAPAVIVHCGSGITACPNLIAVEMAGLPFARLYVGSWSDWVSYPDNPVEKGESRA